ncbi:sensor histidine kinase [Paenibacillus radicis (ex Xue et al. 2023)]|uniref:histidine kinase n=1 Tax=Paenibacillus radicis (ex Xue et al. 2023) TaxID=2972489 RepID=A0ABT1YLW6_9BACL|nr:sensor histidine kinase [Paenibacillus radicis (ex Xue et al. 2023)]MCR8634171.1 sensor histidine kinase [Paenibacillus radicis (ex Xue et al. 2023)]
MRRASFSLKSIYNNMRIKHRVFALISLIMAVCFLTTYFSIQYAYSIYDEQLYSKSSQLLNLSSSGIENELRKIDKLTFNIVTDAQVQNLLPQINQATPEFEKYRIRSYITDRLVQYAGYEKYINSIEVTDTQDGLSQAGQIINSNSSKRQMILKESALGQGETRWIMPDQDENYVIAAREIRSYQNLELNRLGTIIVRIKFDKIVEDVVSGTELKNGEIRITSNGHTIFPIHTNTADETAVTSFNPSHQGYMIKEFNGKQYFFTEIKSGYLGWTYLSLIPFDKIFMKIILMKNILLVGFIASLLVVMALAINFSRSLTRPIEELMGQMRQVQKGDFRLAEAETAGWINVQMDEVGQLQRTFRVMIQQINELITENYAKQLTIKETQFKALQAQINPHFLYNTLESINWMAKANGQPQISRMVESLGFLLRSSISLKETLITVGEEMEIVMNYITIQKFRFEERLIFEMDISDEVKGLLLPKLTLQPLLENSIHYALESMIEPCFIRIWAYREPGRVLLIVEDNGPGMEEELLNQVRRGEARTRGSGIGLKNIEERIIIAFGEGYGLQLDSEPGKSTKVSVIIPDETRSQHV